MYKLSEFCRADLALEGLLPTMETGVRLEIARAAEPFGADHTLMWFLPSVDKVVFLEVSELGKALTAQLALEGALSCMGT